MPASPGGDRGAGTSRPLLSAGLLALGVAVLLFLRPPSEWLRSLAPDGSLESRTARFLDAGPGLWLLAALLLLALALWSSGRKALAGAVAAPAPAPRRPGRWLAPALGALAFLARLVAARFSDIGLGDDGARVFWLESWIESPHAVWSGLWLPAHLYVHALLYSVVRDAVWAGVLLSAIAAGGTVWILARAVEWGWGRRAAACAGVAAALMPVSLAHGATPDVNPVFAFFVVAATAAVWRGRAAGAGVWLLLGWACLATATWMRFDSIVLVPIVAALLLPRWIAAGLFAVAAGLPLVIWNLVAARLAGEGGDAMSVVQQDPTLAGSLVALGFTYMGAIWQAVTLPVVVLGLCGAWRAVRARRSRAWLLVPLAHLAALAGTTLAFHAGTQPRYFILSASVAAAFAGIALDGILSRSRRVGWGIVLLAAILVVVTPPLYPGESDLWVRRAPELRELVDEVARSSAGGQVVWVSEEAAYFYACRIRPPRGRYHALSRPDSEPGTVVSGLATASTAMACVQQKPLPLQRWETLLALLDGAWDVQLLAERGDYRLYSLRRM